MGGLNRPHLRFLAFQLAEVAVPRDLFRKILRRIDDLRPRPVPVQTGEINGNMKMTGRGVSEWRKIWTNGLPNEGRSAKSGHRMAAEGMQFLWRWNGGTIFLNFGIIWEMLV